jgi:hypothetical protein
MKGERQPSENESEEGVEQLFEREIRQALSPAWAKTTQELLPGFLPNKSTGELTQEELAHYRSAYKILGEMVKNDEVEVVFRDEKVPPSTNPLIENETHARPQFKLKTHGGKRSRNEGFSFQGDLATDPQ